MISREAMVVICTLSLVLLGIVTIAALAGPDIANAIMGKCSSCPEKEDLCPDTEFSLTIDVPDGQHCQLFPAENGIYVIVCE